MLRRINDPICDDCLANEIHFSKRQIANATCRHLASEGLVYRQQGFCIRCGKKKITSWRLIDPILDNYPSWVRADANERWFSENNIQAILITWLFNNGYAIRHATTTAIRELNNDIIAVGTDGREMWISVKGYADDQRFIQARHLFASTVLDLALNHSERSDVLLALGLPDGMAIYLELARRITRLRRSMPFTIYWVSESGQVRVEE